ncbi:MAG: hypothetical protein FWF53_01840, partial [Candidatus Azobacteroides sp.]|nr:hypothetical protein [Candidatus Azobacteroides sp.]
MKDVRSPYYLIICLLFVLSSGILSCTINKTKTNTINQEVNKQEMETKYQAVWEQALKNQDFITIDSLISKNRRFILPDGCHSQYTTIKDDENSTPLENMVYWCIDENCELWFNIWNRSEVLKSLQATRNYLTFNDDSIFGSNITNLGGYLDDSFNGNVEDCSGDYNQLPAKRTNEEERIKTIQNA